MLDDRSLDPLVDWRASIVLVHALAPHAGELGLGGQSAVAFTVAGLDPEE
jgi:hypothetical protein